MTTTSITKPVGREIAEPARVERVPDAPVFVCDHGRRQRAMRAAGLTCAVLVGLWVTAVVLGALGDRLPVLGLGVIKPSMIAARPAPHHAQHALLARRHAGSAAPAALAASAQPVTSAPARTALVAYHPSAAPPRPHRAKRRTLALATPRVHRHGSARTPHTTGRGHARGHARHTGRAHAASAIV